MAPPRSEVCGVVSSDRAPVVQGSGGSASATSGCGLGGCRVPVDVNIRESSGTKPGSTRSTLVEVTATARVPTSMSIGLGPTGPIVCFGAPAHRAGQSHATPSGEACKANQQVRSDCGEPFCSTSRSGRRCSIGFQRCSGGDCMSDCTRCRLYGVHSSRVVGVRRGTRDAKHERGFEG